MAKSTKCTWCGARTSNVLTGRCRTCKAAHRRAWKRIEAEGLIVDEAGGAWWVWTKSGDTLVIGEPTKDAAIRALALDSSEAAEAA